MQSDTTTRSEVRIALPSKGRLANDTLELLSRAGLTVDKPNPRQLHATIPSLPGVMVLFQRAGDIVVSVREGSVDFGIAGWDTVAERMGNGDSILVLRKELGFGHCRLCVAVPEGWHARRMADLAGRARSLGHALRVATKFPNLTREFCDRHGIHDVRLILPEGTLEVAPHIGYADIIVDLVSSGRTLRENRLQELEDGEILDSQACLFANRAALVARPDALQVARHLIEFIEAHLRARDNYAVYANIRGESPEAIAARMREKTVIGGLQGPTISRVVHTSEEGWHAVHIVVRRDRLPEAISELRSIGGSGVVVAPVTYIFEEEPETYRAMLAALEESE